MINKSNVSKYTLWIVIIVIVTFIIGAIIYNFGASYVIDRVKALLGLSRIANVYNMYGYQYIDNVVSLGPVLKTYTNVESALVCSNYAAMIDGCVGANYNSTNLTCSCVSDLLPLSDNNDYQVLTLGANNIKNGVSAFTSQTGVRSKGVLFAHESLNYRPAAAALCANIPTCSGYASVFTGSDNRPAGCLLTDTEGANIITSDVNAVMFTGSRTGGQLYNGATANANSGPFYRWGTDVAPDITPMQVRAAMTLDSCSALAQSTNGALVAVWDPIENGTCSVYGDTMPAFVNDPYKTCIYTNRAANPTRYSNTYTASNNVDYPSATTITTGAENTNSLSLDDAILLCANTSGCNCIVQNKTNNNFVFKQVGATDLPSTNNTSMTYLRPNNFV